MTRPGPTDRPPRVDLHRSATLVNSDGVEIDVVVLDLSRGGFRVEVLEDLRVGERVTLRGEYGERFEAEIIWALGNEAGGVFLAPMQEAALHDPNGRPDNE